MFLFLRGKATAERASARSTPCEPTAPRATAAAPEMPATVIQTFEVVSTMFPLLVLYRLD
eukprot:scaffold3808_cov170-Ochromonas_danica.AAC.3